MKTAANMLGSAFFMEGFEVQDAPRYGAERRGAPLFAYVRASRLPIQERGVIVNPDLVVVADESLMAEPAAGVWQGIAAHTVMLVSTRDASAWRHPSGVPGRILALPEGAAPQTELPVQSATCAGAAARVTGAIRRETLEQAVHQELVMRGAEVQAREVYQALAAFDAMRAHAGAVKPGADAQAALPPWPEWIEVPRDDVFAASPDIHAAASSEQSRTGAWRSVRPVIDDDACNRCSWICSTLCPDSAIRVDADRTPHIDYEHCKGCLVCVEVCPPRAIRVEPEHRGALP